MNKKLDYSNVMSWLRCRLIFSLLRPAIAGFRGARSHHGPANHCALDLALAEGSLAAQTAFFFYVGAGKRSGQVNSMDW